MEALRIRLILLIVFFALTASQDTQLNCNGKEFKCVTPNEFLICSDTGNGEKFTNNLQPEKCPEGTYCRNDGQWKCDSTVPPTYTTSTAPTSTSDPATTITESIHATEPIVAGLTIELSSGQEVSNENKIVNTEESQKAETRPEELEDSKVQEVIVKEESETTIGDSTPADSLTSANEMESNKVEYFDNVPSTDIEPSEVSPGENNKENTQDSTTTEGVLSLTENNVEKSEDSHNTVNESAKHPQTETEDPIEAIKDSVDSSDHIVSQTDVIESGSNHSDDIQNQSIESHGIEIEETNQIAEEQVQSQPGDGNKSQSVTEEKAQQTENQPSENTSNDQAEESTNENTAEEKPMEEDSTKNKQDSLNVNNSEAGSPIVQENLSTSDETSKTETKVDDTATILNNNEPNIEEPADVPIVEDALEADGEAPIQEEVFEPNDEHTEKVIVEETATAEVETHNPDSFTELSDTDDNNIAGSVTSGSGDAEHESITAVNDEPCSNGSDQIHDAVSSESDDEIEISTSSDNENSKSDAESNTETERTTSRTGDEGTSLGFEDDEQKSMDEPSSENPNESESITIETQTENSSEDAETSSSSATELSLEDETSTVESEPLNPEDVETSSNSATESTIEDENSTVVESESSSPEDVESTSSSTTESPTTDDSSTAQPATENGVNTDYSEPETTTNSEPTIAPFECSAHGSFPNLTDCHNYVICVKRFVGFLKIERTCPLRFAFNSRFKRCSRDLSPCAELGQIPKCNAPGRFPDPENETKFYWCIQNPFGEFLQYSTDCPKSFVFVPILNRCEKQVAVHNENNDDDDVGDNDDNDNDDDDDDDDDDDHLDVAKLEQKRLKEEAKQRAKEAKAQEKAEKKALKLQEKEDRLIFKTYEKEDKKYLKLQEKEENSNKSNKHEASSEQGTSVRKDEKKKNSSSEENDFICPTEGNFPDENDCTRYIVCSLKKKNKLKKNYLMCPDGQKFDSITKICMEAEEATCLLLSSDA